MAKFPTYEEMSKKVAEKALDEFLYNGRSIREWMQIIASEDCISRQEVLDICDSKDPEYKVRHFKEDVECLPSVTQQQKIGRWIFVDKAHEHAHCSECNYGNVDLLDGRPHNYCPSCGAKMQEVKE